MVATPRTTGLADEDIDRDTLDVFDRRTLPPRHSWPSRPSWRYVPPALNAWHACPLRFSAAAVVLLLKIERFTRDVHARDHRYVPPEEWGVGRSVDVPVGTPFKL